MKVQNLAQIKDQNLLINKAIKYWINFNHKTKFDLRVNQLRKM